MSFNFAIFIGLCYLGFAATCLVESRFAWAGIGICWGLGNLLIAYEMTK